jgi:putative peptidoglycan lipid II flippase
MGTLAQVGLALATSIGAWINLLLVVWFAARTGLMRFDARLKQSLWKLPVAGAVLAVVVLFAAEPVATFCTRWPSMRDEAALVILGGLALLIYAGMAMLLLGRGWFGAFRNRPKDQSVALECD